MSCLLNCPQCGWRSVCDDDELALRLRAVGKLRRVADPEPELVHELFLAAAGEMTCDLCGAAGLSIAGVGDDEGDSWPGARTCQACGGGIERQRIEAIPDTELCFTCQRASEQGASPDEPEYCPKCGSLLVARPSSGGGITRWRMVCTGSPPCRL